MSGRKSAYAGQTVAQTAAIMRAGIERQESSLIAIVCKDPAPSGVNGRMQKLRRSIP
jgi:hypothetical protein